MGRTKSRGCKSHKSFQNAWMKGTAGLDRESKPCTPRGWISGTIKDLGNGGIAWGALGGPDFSNAGGVWKMSTHETTTSL